MSKSFWIDYTNYRGERAWREIEPVGERPALWFGNTQYHPDDQWLLAAYDVQKQAVRDFALAGIHAVRRDRAIEVDALQAPIDMVLHCPNCHMQHIDKPRLASDPGAPPFPAEGMSHEDAQPLIDALADYEASWPNDPHRSHKCHYCGHIWRPADVPTNGVAAVKTKGKNDSPIAGAAS